MTDCVVSPEISAYVMAKLVRFLDNKFGPSNYTYSIEEAAQKGDNYMGVVYRIVISENSGKNNLKLILKVPPQNLFRRQQFFARPGFLREAFAYREFLPLAKIFQASKGLAESETFHEYPAHMFSSTDELNEAVCMEDLRESGFYLHDRFETLSPEQALITMAVYGKLHAISLAMKDQEPEQFKPMLGLVDVFVERKDDAQLKCYFESLKATALACIDQGSESDYWNKLNAYFESDTFYGKMLQLLESQSSEPYAVVCHGDCWTNNIMFKQESGRVNDVRIIDWQIMRYSSPVTDLMYFIMTSTSKEFRKKFMTEMLNTYYSSATEHIRRLGSNPAILYPRWAFDKEFKEKGAIGLLFAMIVLPIITTKGEDAPDLEELSEKVSLGQATDAMKAGFEGTKSTTFREKMSGVIRDTIDYRLI